nr:hypothetical protein BaRGS_026590 [Batillaria attramentaria]
MRTRGTCDDVDNLKVRVGRAAVENDEHSEDATALAADPQVELPLRKRPSLSSDNNTQKTCEEKTEDKKENSISFSNTNLDTAAIVAQKDLPLGEKPVEKAPESTEKEVEEEEGKDVSSTTTSAEKESASDKEKPTEEKKEESAREGREEEGMEKYLAGTDTVVIYPEPVSDHEETENTEDLPATTDEEYTLKCVHCTETFTRAPVLRDHMRTAHPDKPVKYQCPKCEDMFSLKSHLDKHLALHSPTSQVCKVCNKTFANVYRLQRHMISHDESTDLRKFKCPECGKAFKFKHHLKEHIRIHSGEKPFECANCGKRFSHSGSYSSHMNSKKCWVLNMKGRRIDRSGNSEAVNGLLYRPVGVTYSPTATVGGPLQSPPPGAYPGQFLKYDTRGPVVPTLYSPPMTTAGFAAAAYSMLAAGKHIPLPAHHHPPSIIPSSLAHPPPITCPKPPDMSLTWSSRSQISPDVNFNTQLFCLASGDKALALNKASAKEASSPAPVKEEKEKELLEKEVKKEVEEADSEKEKPASDASDKTADSKDSFACKHCNSDFKSPVELHQHERYLCKLNKDILQHMPGSAPVSTTQATTTATTASVSDNCASPGSITSMSDVSRHTTPSGSLCDTATDEEEGEESVGSDGKKYRMRSLISEEQQTVLKARYRENPRPDKNELVNIATEVGFSKRVVQVWFQNMRARDRRRGKEVPYFPNMARFKMGDGGVSTTAPSTTTSTGPCIPAYIPIVPQIFTSASLSSMAADSGSVAKLNGTVHSLSTAGASAEMPLDLSVRKQPPRAHSSSSSPAPSVSPYQCQDQALNLSKKSPSAKEEMSDTSKDVKPAKDSSVRFQHSSIFKYLQQEGLFKNSLKIPKDESGSKPTMPATSDRVAMALNIRSQLLARKNQNSPSKTNGHADDDNHSAAEEQTANASKKESAEAKQDDSDINTETRLVIDERPSEKEDEDMENEDDDDDDDSTDEDGSAGDTDSQRQAYLTGQHNLETLAAVASLEELKQQLGEGAGKSLPKRLRRKSWRQVNMESDEFIVDFDDAVSTEDEDGPQRKRRKSWRGHKVDAELGMYACDQCDKMFSKQSSLARHKYEHSGARPFTCEVCTKAFKHKHHLTEHRRLHSGEKPFQCKKCGKRFSHSGSYSQHMNHRYKYCKPSDGEDE